MRFSSSEILPLARANGFNEHVVEKALHLLHLLTGRVLVFLVLCVLLVGCKTHLTITLYSSDLRAVTPDAPLSTSGVMAIQIPSADECDKYSTRVAGIMKGIIKSFKPAGCKSVEIESFMEAEIALPLVASEKNWVGSDTLFGVVVVDNPKEKGRVVSVVLNRDKYALLNGRMRDEFYQKLDLGESTLTLVLNNDERGNLGLRTGAAFLDRRPVLTMTSFTLKRRGVAKIVLSNVHAAFLAEDGKAGAFVLEPHKGEGS